MAANICDCPACRAKRERERQERARKARRERERQAELAMIDAMIDIAMVGLTLDLILGPPTPEEVDALVTAANKGKRFTVVRGTNGDQSHVGDIYEVVSVCGPVITARGVVSRDGKTNGWYNYNKLQSINTERFKTRPVSAEHVRALRGW